MYDIGQRELSPPPSLVPQIDYVFTTVDLPDCGFAASLGAVAYLNPDWISSHITLTGSGANVSSVTIKMYHPVTLEEQNITETWADSNTNNDDKADVW